MLDHERILSAWSFTERKEMRGLLRSDLYVPDSRRDEEWWHGPLGWTVKIERIPDSPTLSCWIIGPDNQLFAHTSVASVEWLDGTLP